MNIFKILHNDIEDTPEQCFLIDIWTFILAIFNMVLKLVLYISIICQSGKLFVLCGVVFKFGWKILYSGKI